MLDPVAPFWLQALLVVLALAALGNAVYWAVVLHRVHQTQRRFPTAADGRRLADTPAASPAAPAPSVLVIAPAHNEADVIEALVHSLRAQDHPNFHAVIACDRCTDNTAGLARRAAYGDPRLRVETIEHCPEGWAGKVNAVHQALLRSPHAADADLLLFTDADCRLHPACLRAASALLDAQHLDMLSLLPDLDAPDWFERTAQPVAGFELIRQYPLTRVNRADARQRAFANGQFMLFRRAAYHAIGGHEPVRDELLEDIALARRIKSAGLRGGLLLSGGMLRCRMYRSWPAFRRGWKRIYTEAANRRSDRLRLAALRLLTTGLALPAATVLLALLAVFRMARAGGEDRPAAALLLLAAVSLTTWLLGAARLLRHARLPARLAPAWPVGVWHVASILRDAATDLRTGTPTAWGGRTYARPDRAAEARP